MTNGVTVSDSHRRRSGGNEVEKINPFISYPQAKAFKENYKYPLTNTSVSFTATTTAEVKYENKKTDPEISVLGVDEIFVQNSGLEIENGRNFTVFDINNNALDFELAKEVGEYFRLNNEQMEAIIHEVLQSVSQWKKIAKEIGIPRSEQELMEKAFKL